MEIGMLNEKAGKLFEEKRYEEALSIFESMEVVPDEVKPNWAKLWFHCGDAKRALDIISTVDSKEEPDPELLIDYALYLGYNDMEDEAADIFKDLAEVGNEKAKFNLGWHYLSAGKFKEGFESLQAGVDLNVWGNEKSYVDSGVLDRRNKWDGQTKVNKLLFILEGGAGDSIIFFRFVMQASKFCDDLIIACQPEMVRLFYDAMYSLDLDLHRFSVVPHGAISHIEYDAYLPGFQAPYIMQLDSPVTKDVYVKVGSEAMIEYPLSVLRYESGMPLIAMKLWGNKLYDHQTFRKFPPDNLVRICKERANVINLQLDDDGEFDEGCLPAKNIITDWKSTANAIKGVDVVVSSCSGVAHLAASMGIQTIVIVPKVSYFVWTSDDPKYKWYGSHTHIIRQKNHGDWTNCWDELEQTLDNLGYGRRFSK